MIGLGLMSGTSCDGIDAALVEVSVEQGSWRIRQIDAHTCPMDPALRARIFASLRESTTIRDLLPLHMDLGIAFADAGAPRAAPACGTEVAAPA